jgi:tetratricopeptide (TPR) repeat protein
VKPAKVATKAAVSPVAKPLAKPLATPAPKPATKSVAKPVSRAGAKVVAPSSREPRNAKKRSNGHSEAQRLGEALKAFETALGVFNRGDFATARASFQKIVDVYAGQTEIIARSQMYLTVCNRRTQPATSIPRNADSLYDRGIVEINRGQYDTAIALFEKALKSHPAKTGHVLYALAVAQIRAGNLEEGLLNLERAVASNGVCRSRARQDPDLAAVWGHNRFQEIVGDPYEMW